jgi:eukaryotic-like serine/threonine-protein kinase
MTLATVGRYQILEELGRGGMATVYRAHDPHFKREVAVKVLPRQLTHDPMFRIRFEREAQTIATLEHPAIVPVYDFGEEEERPYLVMRYMAGGSLSDRLQQGPLSTQQAIDILSKLAPALDYAHQNGIIHRDLKPGNILFDAQGNPYLADFGIAKLVESTQSLTGSAIIGTPAYISPEQAKGGQEIDGRADIYSLGVILFEMLTGQTPYQADTPVQVIMQHILEPVPAISDLKKDLPLHMQTVIDKAMAKETNHRFATASEMALALAQQDQTGTGAAAIAAVPMATNPPSPLSATTLPQPPATPTMTAVEPPPTPADAAAPVAASPRQKPPVWLLGIGGLLLLLLLIGGLWWAWGGEEQVAEPSPTAPAEVVIIVPTDTATVTAVASPTATATDTPSASPSPTPTTVASPTPPETADREVPFQLEVTLASVNIRQGPGTMYATAGTLRRGDQVEIIARSRRGDWYLVQLADGQTAWLAASVTRPVIPFANDDIPVAATIPVPPTATATATPLPTATPTLPPPPPPPPPTATHTPLPPPTATLEPPEPTATPSDYYP